MKISCTPISVKKALKDGEIDLDGYLKLIARNGAEATDIMDHNYYPWFPDDNLLVALKDSGLKVAAYAAGNNFAQLDPAMFQQNVKYVKDSIHATAELNASNLRIFGGYHREVNAAMSEIDYANGLELVLKGIEAILPEAEKCGVTLALENHGRLPGLSEELLFIMRHFNSPRLGVCFDVANFLAHNMNENEDPIRAYEKLKKYIKHVHFKDWKTAPYGSPKRVVPAILGSGDGIVPIRQMTYLLEKDGFAGYCSLEYEATELEGVAESINYMHSLKKSAELLYSEVKK